MQPLSVRLIQTYLHWQDPTANRRHLGEVMTQVQGEPDLIVLPETFTTGFLGEVGVAPEETVGPTVEWMREMAVRHGCAICGSAAISENGQTLNRFMFVTVQGLQAYYDKRHLFCIGGESERYTAGAERVVIPYKGWRICPQICYDLRFPVWSRYQGDYDCLLYVANWPARRVDAWASLLKARAIENQCYLIAVNRVDMDGNGTEYPGYSVIHDPLGQLLNQPVDSETIIEATLESELLQKIRTSLPFLADADSFELA